MSLRVIGIACWIVLLTAPIGLGQGPVLPPGEDEPLLRLEAGGPTSLVTALAFGPDGDTLYEAGWDKVVRVWARDDATGAFRLDPRATYRVPIGPGLDGAINALALSTDGTWLAVAGIGNVRGGAGFRRSGLMVPAGAKSDEMRRDQGLIYVFNTRTRDVRLLRGHLGPVLSMAFVPDRAGKPPLLVATARERDGIGAVRLWDVSRGEYLGGLWNLPDPSTRPGLAAWHTGAGREQVRVAIAWGDGSLRLWDVEHDRSRAAVLADGASNSTVALLPVAAQGPPRLLTTSATRGQARLSSWETTADRARPAFAGPQVTLPVAPPFQEYPRAVALVAGRPGASPDHAAVVTYRVAPRAAGAPAEPGPVRTGEASLQLIDLRPGRFGTVTTRIPLWNFDPRQPSLPALTVDPRGRSLAVAGDPDRTIRIISIPELFQDRVTPQILSGEGVTIGRVAFVTNGPDRGLRLGAPEPARDGAAPEGDLIFNFTQSRLTADVAGWQTSAPAVDDWRTVGVPAGREWSLSMRQGQGPERRIKLRPGQVGTASALLPPIPPRSEAFAAFAYEEAGEPGLGLYNVDTGEQIRQLTGHAERVRHLAFSADGRLLASTAEDRTVCVWSLTDLDQTLRRRGSLAGVAVTERDGGLVVARVDPDSPARAGDALREGDRIQGIVTAGALRASATSPDFYEALSLLTPGGSLTLRRVRDRGGPTDVTLRLGQGVDERKPLVSLFVTRDGAPGPGGRAWIGWSPLGPYESSGREAEQLLGWHFNTGKPEEPTRFALADQYREFRRPGVLKDLIERGGPAPEPAPAPLPRPGMSLSVDPQGEIDDRGQLLVRRPPSTLNLAVLDRTFPAEKVEWIRWKVGDSPWNDLAPAGEGVWSGDLSRVPWRRGEHQVVVSLRTREATPQEFSERRKIRYQPPPPVLVAEPPRQDVVVVEKAEYSYRARVRPVQGGVKVRLVHRTSDGRSTRKDWQGDQPIEIDQPLTLLPGENTFELIAENRDALPGFEELETTRLPPRRVHYRRAPARPPEVALENLVRVKDGQETGAPHSIAAAGGSPIVVDVPRVRVVGRIAGAAALSEATWSVGNESRGLAGFVPDRAPAFAVSEPIDLAPGSRTYRVRARVADSEFAEAAVTIEYRPPLPALAELIVDPPDAILYDQGRGADPPRVRLSARLIAADDPHPYSATLLVNDEDRPGLAVVDEPGSQLTAEVALGRGDNQIQVRLANAWGTTWISEPLCVTYRRPPRIGAMERPAVGAEPFLDIAATVETPEELPLTRVQIDVQGGESGAIRVIDTAEFRRDGAAWVIAARRVPIAPGENTVRVRAWNADGPCREPAILRGLDYRAPPPPKPDVVILNPGRDRTMGSPSIEVEFRVRSASPLTKVELVRVESEFDRPILFTADLSAVRRDPQGAFEYTTTANVPLKHHDNRLQVVAVNAGGEQSAAVNVSYPPPPVRVVIDRLVPADRSEPAVATTSWEGDRKAFAARLRGGEVSLHGRVIWPDLESRRKKDVTRVQIWINGFPFAFLELRTRDRQDLEAKFEAALLLNRKDNQIAIKLPDLPHEAGDRPDLRVACERPERRQRLHLLIIGVGDDDEDALRARAIKAVEGRFRPGSKTAFETPAFSEGWIYGPLSRDVRRTQVTFQIGQILSALTPARTATAAPLDVVWIYYQGDERIEDGRSLLRLRRLRNLGRNDVMALNELSGFFAGVRGAQLFLLDVTRSHRPTEELLSGPLPGHGDAPSAGLLRFSWLNPTGARGNVPPADAQLLTALEEAIPRAPTVKDMVSEVTRKHSQLIKIYPNLTCDHFVPEGLFDLAVGTP